MRPGSSEVERLLTSNGFTLVRHSKHRIYERSGIRFMVHQGSLADDRAVTYARAAIRRAERAEGKR